MKVLTCGFGPESGPLSPSRRSRRTELHQLILQPRSCCQDWTQQTRKQRLTSEVTSRLHSEKTDFSQTQLFLHVYFYYRAESLAFNVKYLQEVLSVIDSSLTTINRTTKYKQSELMNKNSIFVGLGHYYNTLLLAYKVSYCTNMVVKCKWFQQWTATNCCCCWTCVSMRH